MASDLTKQQEHFAQLVGLRGLRQAVAYREAYDCATSTPKTIWENASRLAADTKVAARIEELRAQAAAKLDATVERIALELSRIAFFDPRDLFDDAGGPIPVSELPEDVARVIAGIDVEDIYRGAGEDREYVGAVRKYKLSSKMDALKTLATWKKMLVNQTEVGKPGDFANLSEDELAREVKGRMVRLGMAKVLPIETAKGNARGGKKKAA